MIYKNIKNKCSKIYDYILRRDFLLALLVSALVILACTSLGYYNNKVVPLNPASTAHYVEEPHNKLSFLSNWDGPDYINISQNGYSDMSEANFFPLYPLSIHIVNLVINSALDSALIVSWTSLVGAVYFYLKVVKKLFKIKSNHEALKAVLLFVLFPTGVFLIATYTTSLFSFLALGAIYYALEKKYLPSVLFAILANATHLTGLIVLLALILLEQKEKVSRVITYFIVGSLGMIGYMAYLYNRYNNAFAFITAQKSHGWLQVHKGYIHTIESTFDKIDILFIVLLILSVIYWWKRRKSFSIYSLTFLLIPVVGGQFGGFDRYALMAFPIQLMVYEKLRDKHLAYSVVLALFAILWAYTVMQYSGGYTGS